jgi:hypothetical protein
MSDNFEELVRKRVNAEREQQAAEESYKKARVQWWQRQVFDLYTQMEEWLRPLLQDQLMHFRRDQVLRDEELIGSYTTHSATISLGKERLKLNPIGTAILGSFGRIDVDGPQGSVMLILNAQKATPESGFTPTNPVWHIVRKDEQTRSAIELNKGSFTDLLSALFGIGE